MRQVIDSSLYPLPDTDAIVWGNRGDQLLEYTKPVWPVNVEIHWPISGSH